MQCYKLKVLEAVDVLQAVSGAACRHPQLFTFNVTGTTAQSSKMLTYLADLVSRKFHPHPVQGSPKPQEPTACEKPCSALPSWQDSLLMYVL